MTYRFADSAQMIWSRVALLSSLAGQEASERDFYAMLDLYYLNNGVYDAIQQAAYEQGIWTEGMKGLRNPAHRVVEFYTAKLWPGMLPKALPVVAKNKRILDPIQQVWTWSNWGAQKQVFSRWFALFGDEFLKVATAGDGSQANSVSRVYLQNIKAQYVVDLDADERGFLTYIRIDIPQTRRVDGKLKAYTHTETWSKPLGIYLQYEHTKGIGADLDQLGSPVVDRPLSDFGIDFVPVVHAKFQDIGQKRGIGAITHALDKIDEANRMATRLHQMIFRYNKTLWALSANDKDPSGRPLPAPRIGGGNAGTEASDVLELGDDQIVRLPGMSKLDSLIPQLNYADHLKILQDHMLELEQDLPELAYYRMRDLGSQLSGRAVRLLLSDAVDKALEARGNAETALARADAMALTIGANAGLFTDIGSYDAGDFEHSFAERDVIALSDTEIAETIKAETGAGVPLVTSLRRHGWSEEELRQLEKDKQAESAAAQSSLAQAMLEAQRRFDQGQPGGPPNNPANPQPGADGQPAGQKAGDPGSNGNQSA